jgi:hypothetical protein
MNRDRIDNLAKQYGLSLKYKESGFCHIYKKDGNILLNIIFEDRVFEYVCGYGTAIELVKTDIEKLQKT